MTAAFLVMAMYLFLVERKKFEKIGFMNPASSEETVKPKSRRGSNVTVRVHAAKKSVMAFQHNNGGFNIQF